MGGRTRRFRLWGTCALTASCVLIASCGSSPLADVAAEAGRIGRAATIPAKLELPPMLGPVLSSLVPETPGLGARIGAIEAQEKNLLAKAAASFRSPTDAEPPRPAVAAPVPVRAERFPSGGPLDWLLPPAHAQGDGAGYVSSLGGFSISLIMGGSAQSIGKGQKAASKGKVFEGKNGEKVGVKTTVASDGTVTNSIDSNIDIPELGISAGTRMSIATKSLCPDTEGRVEMTLKSRRGGNTGNKASVGQDVTAHVVIIVDEQAEVASAEFDIEYQAARSGKGGGADVTGRGKFGADSEGNMEFIGGKSEGTGDFAQLEHDAALAALTLANGAVIGARTHWQGGNCIRLDAQSPGNVARGAVSRIDAKTILRSEGVSIRASVTATSTGGASIDPGKFATPGTLTHTAVNEKDKTMEIALRAVSRRGADTAKLRITTNEQQYWIKGGGGEFRGNGIVCDLKKPFQVFGNANIVVRFTPSTDRGGSYSYTGQIAGSRLYGQGTYAVNYNVGTAVSIDASGPGSVTSPYGTFTRGGSEAYTLTPVSGHPCK